MRDVGDPGSSQPQAAGASQGLRVGNNVLATETAPAKDRTCYVSMGIRASRSGLRLFPGSGTDLA